MARTRAGGDIGPAMVDVDSGVPHQAVDRTFGQSEEPPGPLEPVAPGRRRWASSPVLRWGAVAAACAVLAILVTAAYEGPVANFMERSRQRHLAAAFVVPGKVVPGGPFALLQIGRIRLNAVVGEGDASADLRSGPGHRIGTASPGQPGEAMIAGLASRYGAPFAQLGKLVPGDVIIVQDRNGSGRPLAFDVSETARVPASAIGPPPGAAPTLALVTNAPGASGTEVIVVRANLVAGTTVPGAQSAAPPPPAAPRRGYYAEPALGLRDLAAPALWAVLAGAALGARRRLLAAYPRLVATSVIAPVTVLALLEVLLSADRLIGGGR